MASERVFDKRTIEDAIVKLKDVRRILWEAGVDRKILLHLNDAFDGLTEDYILGICDICGGRAGCSNVHFQVRVEDDILVCDSIVACLACKERTRLAVSDISDGPIVSIVIDASESHRDNVEEFVKRLTNVWTIERS